MSDRGTPLDRGYVDLARPRSASSSRAKGWSAFGAQAVSQRATAATTRFATEPRVAAWLQDAERRRDEPGPAAKGSGMLRHKAISGVRAHPSRAGTATARRHLPPGHFRHVSGSDPNAETEFIPYPLLHVRPIKGGVRNAAGRGPPGVPAGGARTFGTARRETAMGVARGPSGGAARVEPRLYYVPMTR
ncbi:hypothetical protein T492DRAFT_967690 [Pavlovales sp. CCMP2436]|nr:hypothetical protein T492DRAFT_967690 [Pavlovales sp. CCMP2436]